MPPLPRKSRTRRPSRIAAVRGVEALEARNLMATFAVTSLGASGPGSLRQAILAANANPGADSITFGVTGTIRPGQKSLPAITDRVTVDGTSAPGFAGSPVVTIDFRGTKGLKFAGGADGSALRSLSLVKARNAGVTLVASGVTVEGNYIGLRADGRTAAGNRGDGIRVVAASRDNLIGHLDPVSSIDYHNANAVSVQPVSGWQGIRASDTPGNFLISGTSGSNGLLYDGPISGAGGKSYLVNVPGAATTSVYGPDNLDGDAVRLVGSYRTGDDTVLGFLYEGTTDQFGDASRYRTIAQPGAKFNYVHSTMGNFAVGNYDGPTENGLPIGPGRAFLYDVSAGTFVTDIRFPGSISNTAYGIWDNGDGVYTICGGYATTPVNHLADQRRPIGHGYLVDYNARTGEFQHWKSFDYPNGPTGVEFVTHFEGISSVEKGVYTLSAGSSQSGSGTFEQGSFVTVRRETDGTFGEAAWVDLAYPGTSAPVTSDAVYGNQVVGIVLSSAGVFSYQATVNSAFELSNVISSNGGDGIRIDGANHNRVAMNFVGTDATGSLRRGNRGAGIRITRRASGNVLGGQATGGNNPTGGTFVRPPQGNLVSGNGEDGVRIERGATRNTLSGNFVGTAASGNTPLGNGGDGVAIQGANGNSLIGCTFRQDPFVFYNVISGNRGNGLRITNSDDTTVQANFLGVGANNGTIVANGENGMLVSGSSRNTQVGGVIPLGNVISGNRGNGIEVTDRASGFVSFNTFAGIYAFGGAAPNRKDGIHITSRGGDNLIRTCIVSGNLGDGIEIGGAARGVQVTETAVGTNTNITTAIPNGGSGVKLSGRAHGNQIGGFQVSIEPQVTISANRRYGVEIVGTARNNKVIHSYLGTSFDGRADLGNGLGGVVIGPDASFNTIGGPDAASRNTILNSRGAGVTVRSLVGNVVAGNEIAGGSGDGVQVIAKRGRLPGSGSVAVTWVRSNTVRDNAGNGVTLRNARGATIGGAASGDGNTLASNGGYGLQATGLCTGTLVQGNAIAGNAKGGVDLARSRGITYVP